MSKKTVENKTGIPVSTLIDDLKSEDIRKRQVSVQNLNVIASALGPERTRLELIPFLNELIDDEDEILSSLAESLSNFMDFVGGNQNAVVLFSVLESLCKVDECSVRNKGFLMEMHETTVLVDGVKDTFYLLKIIQAASTLISLIKLIDIKKNEDLLQNLVKRLNESENYLAKGPMLQIIPSFYASVSPNFQQELNKMYLAVFNDQIPQVKKQASLNLKDFIAVAAPKSDDVIMTVINASLQEEQDFVRIYMVDACNKYLKTEGTYRNHGAIQQNLKTLSEDKSWRIKYYLCEKLSDVTNALNKADFKKLIFANYIKYLEDQEPELRSIAATKLSVVGAQIEPEEVVSKLLPLVKILVTDTQSYVRNSLAQGFLGLSQFIGKKNSVDLILPVLLQLLKDEDSEVRISLFKSLNQITNVLGIDTLQQSIIPALTDLAMDKNWRIRSSSIDIISFFAKEIGQEFLNEKIIKILMDWLSDRVYAVRESAIQSVRNIISSLGWQWSEKNIMPKVLSLKDQTNYLHRETLLFIIILSNKSINSDYLNKNIIPILISLSKDPVANIRFNVCKCFKALSPSIKEKEQAKKVLQSLCEDADIDVKYFAKQALDTM